MTGLFADREVNPASVDGAFFGRPIQLWYQIAGILTAIGNQCYFSLLKPFLFYIYFLICQASLVHVQHAFFYP